MVISKGWELTSYEVIGAVQVSEEKAWESQVTQLVPYFCHHLTFWHLLYLCTPTYCFQVQALHLFDQEPSLLTGVF